MIPCGVIFATKELFMGQWVPSALSRESLSGRTSGRLKINHYWLKSTLFSISCQISLSGEGESERVEE
jgi:hypothetical protein